MKKIKIVVTQDLGLSNKQKGELKKLGKVVFYDDLAKDEEDWFARCNGFDVVLSGKWCMKKKIYELPNTFFSFRFVGYGWLDLDKCRKNNITVAVSPGCNKDSVAEWMIGFMINLLRRQNYFINIERKVSSEEVSTTGLRGKKVCVLGKGNIGLRVGEVCEAFQMKTVYFGRGDDLLEIVGDSDIIFNCLSLNSTTKNLLNNSFFRKLKNGSYFISCTSDEVFDVQALLAALDAGILSGAGIDAGSIQVGDTENIYYKNLVKHPKVLVTPHIAYDTDVTDCVCNNMMIKNIEAWINDKPINIIT